MVDGTVSRGVDGKASWNPRSEAELDQISTLVKSAIGFDGKRGDTVSVVSMKFTAPNADDVQDLPTGLFGGLHLTRDDIMHLGQSGLLGLFVLLSLLFVVRPMVLRLTGAAAAAESGGNDATSNLGGLSYDSTHGTALSGPQASGTGVALLDAPGAPADESMISIANIDGRLRASSIRQIVDLVGKHPDESLSILRGWLGHEQEAG